MGQYGVASFHARKRDDARARETISGWLCKALPAIEVHDVSDDPDFWKRDIDLVCTLHGHRFTVEIKADQWASSTGNLFLETISVEAKPNRGWLTLTEADLLFYYCAPPPAWVESPYCETDCLYVFVPDRLCDWFFAERRRLLRDPDPEAGQVDRMAATANKRVFDETWHIRATHTIDAETGQYQHTTLGWTVPLEYVNERYFQDTYGHRADQMRRLMVIADVAHHLDALAELMGRYVAWARGPGEKE